MKKIIHAIFTGLLLQCSVSSYAIDYTDLKGYEFEVIIFKFNDTRSAGSEIWPDLVTTESVENSIELHNNFSLTLTPGVDEKGYYYSKIPLEELRLLKEAERLRKSNKYDILYHSAWVQPGLDKENAEFIHIKSQANNSSISTIDTLTQPVNGTALSAEQMIMTPTITEPEEVPLLEGVVKVELARYLHINFDLKYHRNLAANEGVLNSNSLNIYKELKYYPIQTQRRMRSKEIHYIDHPLVGILVLATPFVIAETVELINQPLMKLNEMPVKN